MWACVQHIWMVQGPVVHMVLVGQTELVLVLVVQGPVAHMVLKPIQLVLVLLVPTALVLLLLV